VGSEKLEMAHEISERYGIELNVRGGAGF
jgi:hypothetical protein